MQYQCILGIDFMKESKLTLDFDQKSLFIPDDQIKQLPKVEKPDEIDLSDTKLDQQGLTHVLYHEIDTGYKGQVVSRPYRNDRVKQGINVARGKIRPIQSPYASPVVLTRKNNGLPPDSPEAYRLAIDYRKLNAITKYPRYPLPQREDPELGHIYRYLENPEDGSVNATICEGWSQDFKLMDGLLFYAKYYTTLGELRVYIPRSLRLTIMKELHDLPLAEHLGKRKTYLKMRDTCCFPYMRKYIFEYVSTCDRCQKFNYKNVLPAGRSIPIVSNYPNEIVTLDLLGPYPTFRPERYRFVLVITVHFTKWSELIPLRKASAQAIANALFENYISRYGALLSLISHYGPQFISEVFEHLSHKLDIKHMKTVTYRPQANLTERVNRNLVQMIACFVKENHENWDRFLHEFAFALRTSFNETINKTPAELFLGRKSIKPFSKLINVKEGAEYVGRTIEKLFDEAGQNRRKQHKHWGKYYNRKRREVNIKVNDLVLRGKKVTVNIDQVRVYRPRQSDTISLNSLVETLLEGQRSSDRSSRSQPGKFKGSRKTSSEQNNGHKSNKGNAGWEDPRLKRKVDLNGSGDRKNIYKSKFCGKRSLQRSEHRDQKRPTPEPQQGIKRAIPSSVSSRNHKYRRPNNPSQGSQPIAGPSHQQDSKQDKSPTVANRHEGSGQYNKARETKTTKNGTNRAAERRTVRSKQTTAVRPCPYYLRNRVRQPEGFPEERRNSGLASILQNNIRRSLRQRSSG
ncbi:retrovirus-related Pol polyprotein from transposon 412 [Trichonephila clavipes]|nr:retrovirus-related Pol polyprotein from transposon 412 [Trichonephila clavipes]